MNEVESWYDNAYEEWNRLERHRVEFDITKKFLDQYIVGDNLEIFDIGGGPGRYALYLAEKGHKLTLLDLSRKNIEVAKIESKKLNIEFESYIHGDVLEMDQEDEKYDVVLLMGPLYHLLKEKDRKIALEKSLRVLKPGGLIFAAFISNYAPIQDHLSHLYEIDDVQSLLNYLQDGVNNSDEGFTRAYFSSPDEVRELMQNFNVKELAFAGVENILGCKEKEICSLEPDQYYKWIEVGYRLSTDKNVMGTSQHFLYIGCKK